MDKENAIAVVGAGAAGLACAISAADQGASVILIEKTPHLGGTVTQSLIHTIGGLYDDVGDYVNQGLPVALVQQLEQASDHTTKRKIGKTWTLSVDPEVYAHLVEALIDATGTAEVVRMIDPQLVMPGEALAGLIFQLHGVNHESLRFPQNVAYLRAIRQAVEQGKLPRVCAQTWFDTGIYEDEIYIKLSITAATEQGQNLAKLRESLVDFLRNFSPFSKAKVGRVGRLGIRDGGRIRGEYCLTAADVRSGRKFFDAVCQCAWPIEYWDPHEGIMLEYLPTNQCYQIPLRALQVAEMKNLWAVGKCLSAEKLAQASARVAGTCWAMGDGLGKVVATHEFI
ncbi:FAD-dependent oxidoreductase [Chloroflexi bacterium TSY]|nr:FAD-dependent oxidoreductase [Chloroflexi bacterium TSY]